MKKIFFSLIIFSVSIFLITFILLQSLLPKKTENLSDNTNNLYTKIKTVAYQFDKSILPNDFQNEELVEDRPSFSVFISENEYKYFESFAEAVTFARSLSPAYVYYRDIGKHIWDNIMELPTNIKIEVPLILQMPELPRGCEVTSLSMLLASQGISADKMTLAEKIQKVPAVYKWNDGKVFYGNPNKGFVGDMKNLKNKGYGVYHEPIFKLLQEYLPDEALDITGCEFADLKYYLSNNKPIWVIINSTYSPLSAKNFITWNTVEGSIKITYREHSVLITGYDETFVYFNDPFGNNVSAEKENFISAWEQMGRQAITCAP